MNRIRYPVLYSFRRCPYAIRARLALQLCELRVELREVLLRNKPLAMIEASSKATVPVLCLQNGEVLDQSLEIMLWAFEQSSDPAKLFSERLCQQQQLDLIAQNDTEFKYWLDRYKYHVRYPDNSLEHYRDMGVLFLELLEKRLSVSFYLFGDRPQLADIAIMPFVRQFRAVDLSWFAANGGVRVNSWLRYWLEHPMFKHTMVKFPPWEKEQDPIYF